MSRFVSYYARFRDLRGDVNGLPSWARAVFVAASLPGIALVALSIAAFIASVAVLLIVAVPVYMALRAITGTGGSEDPGLIVNPGLRPGETKHVDSTVRDRGDRAPDEVDGE